MSMETFPAAAPLVILNPAANRGDMGHVRALVRQRIAETGAEYVETAKPGDAATQARVAASQGRAIVIVGGDGTVNEAVSGVLAAGARVPLGIVPAGSGNDFAWNTLRLPKDTPSAVERAFSGDLVSVDAGMVNGRFFANSFSVGLDADIAARAERMKRMPFMSGSRLYYASTLRQLLFGYGRCPTLTVTLDDATDPPPEPRRYVLVAITNGPTYGAGFRINPTADHTDGAFDVCLITFTPLPRALRLLPVVRRGEHAGQREITFQRAQSVHIRSARPVNAQMDGETSSGTDFAARILPGALLVRI